MRRVLTILTIALLPGWAFAGAWPREVGTTFVSLSFTAKGDPTTMTTTGFPQESFSTLYVEHGLMPRLTVGLDAGYSQAGDYSVLAFASRPVGPGDAKNRFALEAGAGVWDSGRQSDTVLHFGLDYGRGISTGLGDGWVAVDTAVQYRVSLQEVIYKADLTVGLATGKRTKIMMQLQAGDYPGSEAYVRLAPSITRQFGPRTQLELGLEAGVIGDSRIGLKLGTWFEF